MVPRVCSWSEGCSWDMWTGRQFCGATQFQMLNVIADSFSKEERSSLYVVTLYISVLSMGQTHISFATRMECVSSISANSLFPDETAVNEFSIELDQYALQVPSPSFLSILILSHPFPQDFSKVPSQYNLSFLYESWQGSSLQSTIKPTTKFRILRSLTMMGSYYIHNSIWVNNTKKSDCCYAKLQLLIKKNVGENTVWIVLD